MDEIEFIKAFNAGYQLRQHDPELLHQLNNSKNDQSDYFKAMSLGAKQFEQEKLLQQIKKLKAQNLEKGKSI